MSQANSSAVFHPFGVYKAALGLWGRYFIPVVAIHGVNVLATRVLKLSVRYAYPIPSGPSGFAVTIFLGLEVVAVIVLSALISLVVIHFLKSAQVQRPVFSEAFVAARRQLGAYLASVFAVVGFALVGFSLAWGFLIGGHFFYALHPGTSFGLVLLLVTSTVSVTFVIATAWYGFYFTLAPLVAALEGRTVVEAFRESRSRIRGNALRYGCVFLAFCVLYLVVGLVVYATLRFAVISPRVLYAIDPAMGAVFGPLWLALWLVSYEKLTEAKKARQKTSMTNS